MECQVELVTEYASVNLLMHRCHVIRSLPNNGTNYMAHELYI